MCRNSNIAQSHSQGPGFGILYELDCVIENHAILCARMCVYNQPTPLRMMCSLLLSEKDVLLQSQTRYRTSWAVLDSDRTMCPYELWDLQPEQHVRQGQGERKMLALLELAADVVGVTKWRSDLVVEV